LTACQVRRRPGKWTARQSDGILLFTSGGYWVWMQRGSRLARNRSDELEEE
jgi:hypothetical protein